jgi:folate-binding protein YgfZ
VSNFIPLATLQISGKDAFTFLQGQLTCDMNNITEVNHPGALCNNKGRIIASFEIQKSGDDFLLHLPANMIAIILKTLNKYARFSEVEFKEINLNLSPLDLLASIRQKIAVILPETSELYTPHELNYHELNYINFNKGCYIGQEIIARMQYLGKLKKQLNYLKLSSLSELSDQTNQIVNSIKIDDLHYEALVVS